MWRDKRIVTGGVIVLIAVSFVVYVLVVRHSQAKDERRAQTAVQQWYDRNHRGAHVVGCKLVDLGPKLLDGFACTVTGPCAGTHTFLVPFKGRLRLYRRRPAC